MDFLFNKSQIFFDVFEIISLSLHVADFGIFVSKGEAILIASDTVLLIDDSFLIYPLLSLVVVNLHYMLSQLPVSLGVRLIDQQKYQIEPRENSI